MKQKNYKDVVYKVFSEEPTLENFRELAQNNLGEQDYVDFKEDFVEKDKLAKLILSFANYGGGIIIFGVKQNEDNSFELKGLKKFEDNADIKNKISKYIPSNLDFSLYSFDFDKSEYSKLEGKKFQILEVESNPKHLPYISTSAGQNIEENAIYIRNGTICEKVNNVQLQRILDQRIKTYHVSEKISVDDHIKQLRLLYDSLKVEKNVNLFTSSIFSVASALSALNTKVTEKSDFYPEEDFDEFIASSIEKKKKRIKIEMDIDF